MIKLKGELWDNAIVKIMCFKVAEKNSKASSICVSQTFITYVYIRCFSARDTLMHIIAW